MSETSVSRRAGLPETGQVVVTNNSMAASGDRSSPVGCTPAMSTSGSRSGSASSGTGTAPHGAQWMIGMGGPQ